MQQPAAYRKAALNAGKAALNAGAIIETIDRTSRCASHRLRSRLPPDPGHRGVTFLNGRNSDISNVWTQPSVLATCNKYNIWTHIRSIDGQEKRKWQALKRGPSIR